MELSFAPDVKIHNRYDLKLIDKNGNIKQEVTAYNEANSLQWICNEPNLNYLYLGQSAVDTTNEGRDVIVTSPWRARIAWNRESSFTDNFPQIIYSSIKATFPATQSYIGQITEVGVAYSGSATDLSSYLLYSHAWLKDAEGNPIVIEKTEYEILEVSATIFFNINLKAPDPQLNFRFFPPEALLLNGMERYINGSPARRPSYIFPSLKGGNNMRFSAWYAPEAKDDLFLENPTTGGIMYHLNVWTNTTKKYNGNSSAQYSRSNYKRDYSNSFPITYSDLSHFFTQNDGNIGFAHSIIFPNFGVISLPNHNIIPEYTIDDISLGTGDGEKTHFFTHINELALDENQKPKLKVYFNGEEVDSSQYYFLNFDIRKSPLWNKVKYVERKSDNKKFVPNEFQNFTPGGEWLLTCQYVNIALSNKVFFLDDINNVADAFSPSSNFDGIYYDENGITLDHIWTGTYIGSAYYPWTPSTFYTYLYYKQEEEEEWILAAEGKTSNSLIFFDSPITAKWWKLSSSMIVSKNFGTAIYPPGTPQFSSSFKIEQGIADPKAFAIGNSAEYDFSKVGLNFYTPPPEGTVITMSATLDLPYKSPEVNMTFSYEAEIPLPTTE